MNRVPRPLRPLSVTRPHAGGFTLIELLIVLALISLLVTIVVPSIGAALESGRRTKCLSNLRQVFLACSMYANEHQGVGPAIGFPWSAMPNWAVVVRAYGTRNALTPRQSFVRNTVLICPTIDRVYAETMTRTYAANVTGHAGQPGDPDSYDDREALAHIRFDRVARPSQTPAFFDAARTPIEGDAPPPPRTASVLDFRREAHVANRLGRFHEKRRVFNAVAFDGSARPYKRIPPSWRNPIP